jgi:hypothetical protein
MRLKLSEIERGWVVHTCPDHGPLVACSPRALVLCGDKAERSKRCNKKATRVPFSASVKPLEMKG